MCKCSKSGGMEQRKDAATMVIKGQRVLGEIIISPAQSFIQ